MNVLLTCAGRRNYLVEYFKAAVGDTGAVYVTDMNQDAPAMHEADKGLIVPAVDDAGYLSSILRLCEKEKIRLLVSLNDLELPLLAEHKEELDKIGVKVAISGLDMVNTCFDKLRFYQFLKNAGIPTAETYSNFEECKAAIKRGELSYPIIVKPRWGTASIGLDIVDDEEELELAVLLARRRVMRTFLAKASGEDVERCVLMQEKLSGVEYGVDLISDLNGSYRSCFVKRKLGMRAGETDKAVTEVVPEIEALGRKLVSALGTIGLVDCDFFWDGNNASVLEINPRFGGGYPFSHVAGANIPAALVAWAEGREAKDEWLKIKTGVGAAKCDRLVCISGTVI